MASPKTQRFPKNSKPKYLAEKTKHSLKARQGHIEHVGKFSASILKNGVDISMWRNFGVLCLNHIYLVRIYLVYRLPSLETIYFNIILTRYQGMMYQCVLGGTRYQLFTCLWGKSRPRVFAEVFGLKPKIAGFYWCSGTYAVLRTPQKQCSSACYIPVVTCITQLTLDADGGIGPAVEKLAKNCNVENIPGDI